MQISKELMDAFYERSRRSLDGDDFEAAQLWSDLESYVNNIHHGKHPQEWLPRVSSTIEEMQQEQADTELKPLYDEALELVATAMLLYPSESA